MKSEKWGLMYFSVFRIEVEGLIMKNWIELGFCSRNEKLYLRYFPLFK